MAWQADADFAGCVDSLRPPSGGHLNLQGPNTRFLLSGSSKQQGCVSHSTPEAEIVAADVAMRSISRSWSVFSRRRRSLCSSTKQSMISVVRSGRSPTMRGLERSHGVSTWMHNMFERDYVCLAHEVTDRMAADIHTKAFNDSRKWKHACVQIGLLEASLKIVTSSFDPIKGTNTCKT